MAETIILPDGCGNKVTVIFDERNIHIRDSYKITKSENMQFILQLVKYATDNRDIKYKRTIRSWLREWKAHNILYKFNIRRSSSQSTDLSEKESWQRRLAYFVLSLFYWK